MLEFKELDHVDDSDELQEILASTQQIAQFQEIMNRELLQADEKLDNIQINNETQKEKVAQIASEMTDAQRETLSARGKIITGAFTGIFGVFGAINGVGGAIGSAIGAAIGTVVTKVSQFRLNEKAEEEETK